MNLIIYCYISGTKISKMDLSVDNERLPRPRIGTNKRSNERFASAKRPKLSPKTLDDLPDEVLLKICAYLSMKNLVRCSGVSIQINCLPQRFIMANTPDPFGNSRTTNKIFHA